MYKYFWNKIKSFFVTQSRLSRVTIVMTLVVAVVGVFGFAFPADAILDSIAKIFANIFLLIASLLGQILTLLIGLLLDVVSYNNFMDAEAVNYGWTVVRDICNLFFVLILLVIGFGSVLRLENFKYNQLLGKLVIMIVLVNFSKMIAGFFIDISQVVLMTFTNAFADTAAENFISSLKLREMLGFVDEGAGGTDITQGFSALEIFGLALLPVIMLIVAIFVMLAMLLVFLLRILMLWILVVLSPLAYLLSVLPSSQQYSKQWWSHFTKWVVTGPVLAFFIWFALTLIAGGGLEPSSFELENQTQIVGVTATAETSDLAIGVGQVSSSESILQFAMAIGLFVISLLTAQSLGGIAGQFSGKMLGKLQTMGAGAMNRMVKGSVPALAAKGAGELAKMGGRKVRRELRDRTPLGAISNLVQGAKARGQEVETRSKELAVARGRDAWDKRPKWMGGGAEPISENMMVRARHQRQKAAEVGTLQKEQKADHLEKLTKGGASLENVLDRQAVLMAMGNEAHIDDAMATEHFRLKQEWSDEYGQKHKGFAKRKVSKKELADEVAKQNITQKDGEDDEAFENRKKIAEDAAKLKLEYSGDDKLRKNFRNTESTAHFMKAMVSKNYSTKAEDIDESGSRALYDIEGIMMKNSHYYAAGAARYNKRLGRLATTTPEEQRGIINTEFHKQDERGVMKAQNHNFSEQYLTSDGRNMYIIPDARKKDSVEYDRYQELRGIGRNNQGEYIKHGYVRHGEFLGDYESDTNRHEIYNEEEFEDSLAELYKNSAPLLNAIEKKSNNKGYVQYGKNEDGTYNKDDVIFEGKNLDEFATFKRKQAKEQLEANEITQEQHDEVQKKWSKNEEYLHPVEKVERERKATHQETENKINGKQNDVEKKEESISQNRKKADKLLSEAAELPEDKQAERDEKLSEADKLETKIIKEKDEVTKLKTEIAEASMDLHTKDIAHELGNMQVEFSPESIQNLSNAISGTMNDIELSTDGIDFDQLNGSIDEIGNKLEEALVNATPEERDDIMARFEKSKQGIEIGTVSEKSVQMRMIQALNRLSNILKQ